MFYVTCMGCTKNNPLYRASLVFYSDLAMILQIEMSATSFFQNQSLLLKYYRYTLHSLRLVPKATTSRLWRRISGQFCTISHKTYDAVGMRCDFHAH